MLCEWHKVRKMMGMLTEFGGNPLRSSPPTSSKIKIKERFIDSKSIKYLVIEVSKTQSYSSFCIEKNYFLGSFFFMIGS